ncbi:MAG: GNAT family N-acetyltransferase [Oscillospiraceae bacterium]|nr:GNAT family N-acetyltransferase [Oscillospiraceae bacterium]
MSIRKSTANDLPAMLALYADARRFMAENGNPNQWVNGYPAREMLEADIASGNSYVCEEDGKVVGTFYFVIGDDPTYAVIEDGAWLDDEQYGVVHRITSALGTRGVASFCLDWCYRQHGNIRIDTHADNIPMQKCVLKNGFVRCGIIHLENGDPRIAYQRGARAGKRG